MSDLGFLSDTAVLLGAALVVAWLFRMFRAPTVIGFLASGLLIGPSGFGFIRHEEVEAFAQFGLALLLFTVGLELSPGPLLRSGRRLLIASLAQLFGTALLAAVVIRWQLPVSFGGAALLGVVVAISSSAIILGYLSQTSQTDSITGTIAAGICVAQDFAVIAILLALPLMSPTAGGTWPALAFRGVGSVGGLVIVIWGTRVALPYVLDRVLARGGRELMTLLAVAIACAGAWLAGMAGWSWALGAFIAGLLLSETDIRHQLVADVTPFRDVFNALFFISLGMLVDFGEIRGHAAGLLLAICATLVGKTLLTALAVGIAGWPARIGLHLGLMLATVSEFGYVLAIEANRLGFLPAGLIQYIIAYAVGTMVAGAALVPIAGRIANGVAARVPRRTDDHPPVPGPHAESGLSGHVIVIGSGFSGQNLCRVLRATGIPHAVIEMNRSLAAQVRAAGSRVVVGDATRQFILERASIQAARAIVIVINDRPATQRIVAQARALRADLYILARTHYVGELDVLCHLGAGQVISEEFESSIEIFAHVLKEFAIPDNVIEAQIAFVRAGRYAMLRGMPVTGAPPDLVKMLERAATQTYYLDAGCCACGRTLRELDLRATTGATVIAVVRKGNPQTNPGPEFRFEASDVLVLVGTHRQIDDARQALK